MRVCIVTAFPRDPAAPHGGVEAVSVVLVEALAALSELTVDVVTTDRGRSDIDRLKWRGATIHRLPSTGRLMLTSVLGSDAALVRKYVTDLRPEVVHAHDVYGAMVRGVPVPRVFTIHGFIHADTLVSGGQLPWLRSKIWRWIEVRGWRDQSRIVSISPYVREHLPPGLGVRVHDIDNPVAPEFFDVVRQDDGLTILYTGVVNARKNVLTLVDAVSRLVSDGIDVRLRIAGAITDAAYGAAVVARIRDCRLQHHVELLGTLTSAAVRKELSTCSVFALPSIEENSPISIEEAMAAGVPVVSSNRCGMPYLIKDGETGLLIDPEQSSDLADAIATLLADAEARIRMGRTARAVAADRFHPASVARRTREVYMQLAYGRRPADHSSALSPRS